VSLYVSHCRSLGSGSGSIAAQGRHAAADEEAESE